MNHKKKRPINRRASCKLCSPWKINKPRKSSALTLQDKKTIGEIEAYWREFGLE